MGKEWEEVTTTPEKSTHRRIVKKEIGLLLLAILPLALSPLLYHIFNPAPVNLDIGRFKDAEGEVIALRELSHQLRWHPRAKLVKIIWHPWKPPKPNQVNVMLYDRLKSEYILRYSYYRDGYSMIMCWVREGEIHKNAKVGHPLFLTDKCGVS